MDSAECLEWDRIVFMIDRDGAPAAHAFAEQGISQYESAIRAADSGGNQYAAAYRNSLMSSNRVFRQYLEDNETPPKSQGAP